MLEIKKTRSDLPIDYAAEELKKYFRMMNPDGGDVTLALDPSAASGFRVGLMSDFGLDTSDTDDLSLDDIVYIDCDAEGGIIAGSNSRATLIAVYEYLKAQGCRWLMPGLDGEYIPMKALSPVSYRHKASSRIRGICIEGYTSQDMLREFVDFMPKLGLNAFMIQFKFTEEYYLRQYNHYYNEELCHPEPISQIQARQWTAQLEFDFQKRGIFFHSYGHGFNTDPFGIDSSLGWAKVDPSAFSEETMQYYALIDGKRRFTQNQPLNTQLCMSNVAARKKVCDYVVDYMKDRANVDYLHIWLADGLNNHCECEECRKYRPSDLYVKMLNEIDEALTAAGNNTKIIAIVYVDNFWAPEIEKLNNKSGRFTLMVAPITRDYTKGFDAEAPMPELRPYERNKLVFPKTFEENMAYYREWIKSFDGDRFVFEYHFWKHQHFDLCGRMLAKCIYDDVAAYRALGEDGLMQCGSQRDFFPNGFAFYTNARYLFDASLTFEEIEIDYHTHAYGEDYKKFTDILDEITKAIPYEYISPMHAEARPDGYATANAKAGFEKAMAERERLLSVISENYNSDVRVRTVSVRLLEGFCLYLEKFIPVLERLSENDLDGASAALDVFAREIGILDLKYEKYFDYGQALSIYHWRLLRPLLKKAGKIQ